MRLCAAAIACAGAASAAFAGPLTDDSVGVINGDGVVMGSTLFSSGADNTFNGRFGLATGSDVYPGGDEVWIIDHGGGMLDITLVFDDALADLDLFLYDMDVAPSGAGSEIANSLGFTTTESISGTFGMGRYYLIVDTFSDDGSDYTLTVDGTPIPAPAGLAAFGLGGLAACRRRRA